MSERHTVDDITPAMPRYADEEEKMLLSDDALRVDDTHEDER